MERNQWLWWKPLVGIAIASLVAALFVFQGDIWRELVVVICVVALLAVGRLLRGR